MRRRLASVGEVPRCRHNSGTGQTRRRRPGSPVCPGRLAGGATLLPRPVKVLAVHPAGPGVADAWLLLDVPTADEATVHGYLTAEGRYLVGRRGNFALTTSGGFPSRDLGDVLEDVARLGARLLLRARWRPRSIPWPSLVIITARACPVRVALGLSGGPSWQDSPAPFGPVVLSRPDCRLLAAATGPASSGHTSRQSPTGGAPAVHHAIVRPPWSSASTVANGTSEEEGTENSATKNLTG